MSLTIGVDVGGTKIAAGVVDEKGSIVEMVKRPTPAANASRTIDVISDAVRELLARYEVDAVGIGAAGFVEESRSAVMFAPNWPGGRSPSRARSKSGPASRSSWRTTPTPRPGPRPSLGPVATTTTSS